MHAPSLLARFAVALALAVVLGTPLAFRLWGGQGSDRGGADPVPATHDSAHPSPDQAPLRLVIISPHNEQIRYEFAREFDRWHREHFGRPAIVDWRQPGGTAEIRKLLMSQYAQALQTGRLAPDGALAPAAPPMPYDLCFGGGTYEHGLLKQGVSVELDAPRGPTKVSLSISIPLGVEQPQLDEWFGRRGELVGWCRAAPTPIPIFIDRARIGVTPLYDPPDFAKKDPGQYWVATALTAFGIIFNRDALRDLGLPEPSAWSDLADDRLIGWVSLADPRQSGSIATAYEAVLNKYGWTRGWWIVRRMSANARPFAASSLRVPLDVSQGQAAVGAAIDYYGRYQSHAFEAIAPPGQPSRVGYVDPPGGVSVDPDPISLLRAGPSPELARRFVAFSLSERGQALWCFRVRTGDAAHNAEGDDLGPHRFALRRMPVRRDMFQRYADRIIDRVDLYALASSAPNRGWRSAVGPMIGAFAIDSYDDMVAAWKAIRDARRRGVDGAIIDQAVALFDSFPVHTIPATASEPARTLPFDQANFRAIREDWRAAERDGRLAQIRMQYTASFTRTYRQIGAMLNAASTPSAPPPTEPAP